MDKKNVVCSSAILGDDMHVNVYGKKGLPVVVFPTQGMDPENLEEVGMVDELADYVDSGTIQLFCTQTIDDESWGSDADPEQRAQRQETYYHYVVDELVPLVHKVAGSDARPLALGADAGATQAAIVALRRPDLFQGCVCLSGCYDSRRYFGDWMDATLYDNTPCSFLAQMPVDHPYVAVYNQRQLLFCTGQDASEADSLRSTRVMGACLERLGVDAWCDYWGADVTHTWFWWKKQLRYFMPIVLADVEKTTTAEKPVPAKKRTTTRKKAAAKKPATKAATAKAEQDAAPAAAVKPAAKKTTAAKAAATTAEKPAAAKAAPKKAAAKAKPAAEKPAAAAEKPAAAAEKPAAAAKKPAAKKAAPKATAAKPAAKAAPAKKAEAVPAQKAPIAKAEKPAAPAKATKPAVPAKAVKAEVPAKAEPKPAAKPAAKAEPKPAAAKAEPKKAAATKAKPAAKKPAKGSASSK